MTFNIVQLDDGKSERLPVSYKIREYFEKLISDKILIPNKIISNDKWYHKIAILFDHGNNDWSDMNANIKAEKGVVLFPTRTFSSDKIKSHGLVLSYSQVTNSANPPQEYARLIFRGLRLFFQTNYKKVSNEDLDKLEEQIDYAYLNSLPYPASFEDQKYEGDNNGSRVKVTSYSTKS